MAAPWLVVRASQATESYLKVFGHQATGIHLQIFLDVFAQFFAFITYLFIYLFWGGGQGEVLEFSELLLILLEFTVGKTTFSLKSICY